VRSDGEVKSGGMLAVGLLLIGRSGERAKTVTALRSLRVADFV
jgi:hypothetical protein